MRSENLSVKSKLGLICFKNLLKERNWTCPLKNVTRYLNGEKTKREKEREKKRGIEKSERRKSRHFREKLLSRMVISDSSFPLFTPTLGEVHLDRHLHLCPRWRRN